jgi:AcrR family transcriptional regulator
LADARDALVVLRRKIDGTGSVSRTYESFKRSFDTQDLRRGDERLRDRAGRAECIPQQMSLGTRQARRRTQVGGNVIPIGGKPANPPGTKERILDAAEALFMAHGYEATSLRAITAAAEVNLAAVNYHFGSKEVLFEAVLTRRLDPMNQRRVALLGQLEDAAAPAPVASERILSALLVPALELARDPERGGGNFLRLLGRAYADPAPFIRRFLAAQYAEMIGRFKTAFGRALPHLPARELSWRLHFLMGALSYTLAGTDALKLIAEIAPGDGGASSDELLLARLAPFLLAGLTAPLPDLSAAGSSLDDALARD